MKKAIALILVMMLAYSPLSFAMCKFCEKAQSDKYVESAFGKLGRGLTNVAFGWYELFRQPQINENHWEGVGRGVVHTIGRTGSGILEVATFLIPQAEIPLPDPNCAADMFHKSSASA